MTQTKSLPLGWAQTNLGQVLELEYGKALPAKKRDNEGFPVYGSNGVVGYHSEPLLRGPALIVGRKGSIGEVHLSDGACSPIDTTYFVDKFNGQPPTFWLNVLRSLPLTKMNRAVALPGLNRNEAYELKILLPPAEEQKRIADRIDALQERNRRARAALESARRMLDDLRRSVLAAAFRGDLTASWRKENPDVEPASVLLERVRVEHRRRWEEAELAKMRAKGKKSKDDGWKKKYSEPEPVDAEGLPELPEGWCWATINELAELINGDRGKNYPNIKEYVSRGLAFINTGHIEPDGSLSLERMNYISREKFESLGSGKIAPGDLVYCLRGATLGKTARVDPFVEGAIASSLVIIRPTSRIFTDYLYYFLVSPLGRDEIRKYDNGSAQPNLSAGSVEKYLIPVAPCDEMVQVIEKCRESQATATRITGAVMQGAERLTTLDQSILAKAFRGELVPQDPADEPASVLLDRIRAERDAKEPRKRATRKKRG